MDTDLMAARNSNRRRLRTHAAQAFGWFRREALASHGRHVYVWTVNERREMAAFAAIGVQGLISDYPERFAKLATR